MTGKIDIRELASARQQARETLDVVRRELLDARTPDGHWEGRLASSALSTATAISAMSAVLLNRNSGSDLENESLLRDLIRRGIAYLRDQQNDDGGFGDTDLSHSNVATSYLVLAASTLAQKIGEDALQDDALERLSRAIDTAGGMEGLRKRYGKDKTFVVPIMNNLAIAGLISWDEVDALPFEAAVFPQSMYRFLRMPVVSYAIPALVSIGQAKHFLGRPAFLPLRWIRAASVARTLGVLERMQPESGGYLEATPLTAFVVMSLAATGRCELSVVRSGLRFLVDSALDDGSWPIDTNLATWVTSLSIHALACDPQDDAGWCDSALIDWHLGCQHRVRHPFTGAEPGGWGWTDLSGAVPDSDDTPAAILSLLLASKHVDTDTNQRIESAVRLGIDWLLRLQNRNGGWPTFCRGWGKLPFDRSSTDLTAHAMRALTAFQASLGSHADTDHPQIGESMRRGNRFLHREQLQDGAWLPLWFGNQDRHDESNPIYGTAKVLIAGHTSAESQTRAMSFLIAEQNADGGWGGGMSISTKLAQRKTAGQDSELNIPADLESSVEETALVVEALTTVILRSRENIPDHSKKISVQRSDSASGGFKDSPQNVDSEHLDTGNGRLAAAILAGVDFLAESVRDRRHTVAWPIGFYFAKLWYHEKLYPLIFTVAALGKFLRASSEECDSDWPR